MGELYIQFVKNERFTARIDGWASDGSGVCHVGGRAVFAKGAIPGELWELKLVRVTASAAWARGEKLLEASPDRREPPCPVYGKCGGCALLHVDYSAELDFKLSRVNEALRRIGGLDFQISEILGAEKTEGYRNKSILAVAAGENGPVAGFYRQRSHEVVPAERCLLQSPLSEAAVPYPLSPYAISKVAGEAATRAYGEYRGLRVFVARPSNHTGPGQTTKFVVPSFVEQAKAIRRGERDRFTAGNLASGRDFSDVRDIVAAYRIILEKGAPGETYNVSAAPRVTIAELFDEIRKAAGVDAPVESDPALVRPTDFSRALDTAKLRALGWNPSRTLADTLRDMLGA